MTPSRFATALKNAGYTKETVPRGSRFSIERDGVTRYVARSSVRGGAWRLHMAIGDVPTDWPTYELNPTKTWIEAESPWFEYFTDLDPDDPEDAQFDSRESTLQKCHDWFFGIGIGWLHTPENMTDDEWRTEHNILVKRRGS